MARWIGEATEFTHGRGRTVDLDKRWREREDARAALRAAEVEPDAALPDFHTLSARQVEALDEQADLRRYRKPRRANGSRARYFYAFMCRRARAYVPRRC